MTIEQVRGESFWLRADLMETAERARKYGILLDQVLARLEALRGEIVAAVEDFGQAELF